MRFLSYENSKAIDPTLTESDYEEKIYQPYILKIAVALHEDWRTDYVNDPTNRYHDGTLKKKFGNIENLPFDEIGDEWKHENIEASKVVANLVARKNAGETLDYNDIGNEIHNSWLARNPLAYAHPVYKKPFAELTAREQLKDVNQYLIATAIDDANNLILG